MGCVVQRLGKNHGGYFGERINVGEVLREIESAARQHGWSITTIRSDGDFRWLALHRPPQASDPATRARRIYLSTGIHGDEPAGPLAVLQLLRNHQWPPLVELFLCPCLNPAGFVRNLRENGQGIDLNRDYLHPQSPEVRAHVAWLEQQPGFELAFCLHEDWESHGFYVYELNPDHQPSLAGTMVAAVRPVCPVDPSTVIEGRAAENGIIRPQLDPTSRPQWPEAFWLITHKTRLSYTLEAPSDFPLGTRVEALVAAVNAGVREFLRQTPARPSGSF